MNKCVILTACVSPNKQVSELELTDSNVRRMQYIESLRFYIKSTRIDRIVFCDNSNAEVDKDILSLAKRYHKQMEWISFYGNEEKVKKQGKGYGEGEILEYAIKHSKLVISSDYIIKITGRLIIKNIDDLVRRINADYCYFDHICLEGKTPFVSTKLFMIPKVMFEKYFINKYTEVNDGSHQFIEHVYAKILIENRDKILRKCFSKFPNMQGVSGSSGEVYEYDFFHRAYYTILMKFKKDEY